MTRIVCVGTSDAFGSGGRRQSAYLVESGAGSFLVDCGSTTTMGLEALELPRDSIGAIVVSHFHADHFGGIPIFLLAANYVDERTRPLQIAGPRGIEERVRRAAAALGHPIDGRDLGFPLVFEELEAGKPCTLAGAEVESFETYHAPDAQPHGLRCRIDGQTLAYSGDTGWFDALPGEVRGADLFLCECTQDRAGYEYHLSLEELARHRPAFDCGRIVLTHLGPEMRERAEHEGFEVADDGQVLELDGRTGA